jgi:hypothetical protein
MIRIGMGSASGRTERIGQIFGIRGSQSSFFRQFHIAAVLGGVHHVLHLPGLEKDAAINIKAGTSLVELAMGICRFIALYCYRDCFCRFNVYEFF